jgi:flagellar basal-body rod protein FlgC
MGLIMKKCYNKNIGFKNICKLSGLIIISSFFVSCAKKDDIKLIIFKEYQNKLLDDIISYKNYKVKMIDKGNYWIMENTSEDMLLDIINITLLKMDIIADNIANEKTTRTAEGGPYIRKILNISPEKGIEIINDTKSENVLMWDPTHPDAIINGDRRGYVMLPNVDIMIERMDLMSTSKLYNAVSEYLKMKYKIVILY